MDHHPAPTLRCSRLTRRGALAGVTGSLLLAFASRGAASAVPERASLFAFGAPSSDALVFAIALPRAARQQAFEAVIHAGGRRWSAVGTPEESRIVVDDHHRIFIGEVASPLPSSPARHAAFAVETTELRTDADLEVWAEVFDERGERTRIGNPFTAAILDGEPDLIDAHDRSWPGDDPDRLADAFAERIAAAAAAGGCVADPRAHGRRLAQRLLPDVLAYRSSLPCGFSHAMQNGRHPGDDAASIVATILAGATRPVPVRRRVRPSPVFPYLALPTARAPASRGLEVA